MTITAQYSGDQQYAAGQGTTTVTVNKASTTASLTGPGSSGANQTATFTATISATGPGGGVPTGNVTFTVRNVNNNVVGTPATIPVNGSGVATYNIATLPRGTYTVTAVYNGSTGYNGSTSNTVSHTVLAAATVSTPTSSKNPAGPGNTVRFTTTVSGRHVRDADRDGAVLQRRHRDRVADDAERRDGVHRRRRHQPRAGGARDHRGVHPGGRQPVCGGHVRGITQSVKANTTTSLTTSGSPAQKGSPVTFTATVTGVSGTVPTGSVTFKNGTTTLATMTLDGSGVATYTTSTLPVGNLTITATYSGDTKYNVSSGTVSQTIQPIASSITATPSTTQPVVNTLFTMDVVANKPGGGTATNYNGETVTAAVISGPVGGVLNGIKTATFSAGVAKFTAANNLSFSKIGSYTVRLTTSDGLTTTVVFNVIGGGRQT